MEQAEHERDRAELERDGVVRKLADANKTLEELQEDNQNQEGIIKRYSDKINDLEDRLRRLDSKVDKGNR